MITVVVKTSKSIQTAFRFDPLLLGRLKTGAAQNHLSLNAYVSKILARATEDIESEAEILANKKKTERFLSEFSGKWSGTESPEDIMSSIKADAGAKKIVAL